MVSLLPLYLASHLLLSGLYELHESLFASVFVAVAAVNAVVCHTDFFFELF